MDFAQRTTTASPVRLFRLFRSIWRQSLYTPLCPELPRLDGKLALVTGGNVGIGLETSLGLGRRGAEVVIMARSAATADAARARIQQETGVRAHYVPLDLGNLESVVTATENLGERLRGRKLDILVANAGIWPQAYAQSAQGHEIAFAVNTLGHYVLIRRLLDQNWLLAPGGRVVILTGDIYIRSSDCTSDFTYAGSSGGGLAYCRSKLGNLWTAAELQRRHPELHVTVVHPGVVASELTGEMKGFAAFMKNRTLLSVSAGAQTSLFCATQPNLERGGYYHNTMGLVRLPARDPASDSPKAAALWTRMEELSTAFR
jgi:NAD(P)-dependent dehydrogenase (short-subunit alcohol dehydrogenase family)